MDSCFPCGGCRDSPALPADGVRLSRAGSARTRGADDCVGTFQTGGWSVHAERRQGAENRLCSVGFQGGSLLGMAVRAHDLVALFDESCGEAGADAAGHPDGEARDMAPSPLLVDDPGCFRLGLSRWPRW